MAEPLEIPEETVEKLLEEWADAIAWTYAAEQVEVQAWYDTALDEMDEMLDAWSTLREQETSQAFTIITYLYWFGLGGAGRRPLFGPTGKPIRPPAELAWPLLSPVLDAFYDEGVAIEGAVSLVDPNQLPRYITVGDIEAVVDHFYENPEGEAKFVLDAGTYISLHARRVEAGDRIAREWMKLPSFPVEFRHIDWNRRDAFTYAPEYITAVMRYEEHE